MSMGYLHWFRIYLEQTNNIDKARIPVTSMRINIYSITDYIRRMVCGVSNEKYFYQKFVYFLTRGCEHR